MVNLNNLFLLIEKSGLKITKVSQETGISQGNISDWKSGRSMPSATKLDILANYFDVSVDYLLGRTNNSQNYSNNNISNSTNIAIGENSSAGASTTQSVKAVEKLIIRGSNFSFLDRITCPFCHQKFSKKIGDTIAEISISPKECYQIFPVIGSGLSSDSFINENNNTNTYNIQLATCSYCSQTSCKVLDVDRKKWIFIYPNNSFQNFEDKVPPEIYKDYSEACAVLHISPNASAALSRRCLQHMIRERWGIECEKINSEINNISKDNISRPERKALHAIQKIGNIGVHPNELLEVPIAEAELTIKVIEIFLTKWYIDNPKDECLIEEIKNSTKRINNVSS